MNAIKFLVREHDNVRTILKDLSSDTHRHETKRKIFDDLSFKLLRHEKLEHKVWYPHFKSNPKLNDEVKHLLVEEKTAEKKIKELQGIADEAEWDKQFAKFKKDVEHHAHEEETKLFPQVEKLLDAATLEKIGKDMLHFEQEYKE